LEFTVPANPDGPVDDVDGERFDQGYGKFFLRLHFILDAIRIPAGFVFQEILRQFNWMFDANAAMAVVSFRGVEQMSSGCIVQIHVELVGEHELHLTQGIARTRALP